MKCLLVDFENCYGIKKLTHQFDFSKDCIYAIYAPNGTMKTSFAKTFHDLSEGEQSSDHIFSTRTAKRAITDEDAKELDPKSVFAVRPYDEEFGSDERTALLLVNAKLRKEYRQLYSDIDAAKDVLLKALREQSRSKRDFEREASVAFATGDDFYKAMIRIKQELAEQKDTPFSDVEYDRIFDEKALSVVGDNKDVKGAIDEYVSRYNELLEASIYFKKGTFDYYNAGRIAKTLTDNGFFAAKHQVVLNSEHEKVEISTEKELIEVIAKEKEQIIKDTELRKQFDKIAALLDKNEALREFRAYLMDHPELATRLTDLNLFKQDVIKSYLRNAYDLYLELLKRYEAAAERRKQIEEEAAKQRTQWEDVIEIFNSRFVVPFRLEVKNRTAAMLGESVLTLGFTYVDDAAKEKASIGKSDLLAVLSTGERKAFYILNIIFEVEVRRKENRETLFVIDDIADSFDYQNKYAILQYLDDIKHGGLFKQIIMTHNFDFFRAINSRIIERYANCLMAVRNSDGSITLQKASGIQNPFLRDWKDNFFKDVRKRIASVAFIRALIEHVRGQEDASFKKLTSLMHWMPDTNTITESDLDEVYTEFFGVKGSSANPKRLVIDAIYDEASKCMNEFSGVKLENKIVLSIAIRLASEKYMVSKINDQKFVSQIESNQTRMLFNKFKELGGSASDVEVLGRVNLMTPENIHLNSFMYEPLVDMSDEHLKRLYNDVLALK